MVSDQGMPRRLKRRMQREESPERARLLAVNRSSDSISAPAAIILRMPNQRTSRGMANPIKIISTELKEELKLLAVMRCDAMPEVVDSQARKKKK